MKKILIVDDEPEIRYLVREFLLAQGYETETAGDLKEAEEKIENFRPFLVLLDIRLPDGYGIDFLKKIKPKYPEIEIIMVTGLSDREIALEAIENGATDYITKPIDLNYLSTSVMAKILSAY